SDTQYGQLAVQRSDVTSPLDGEPENSPVQPMTVGVSSLSTGVHSNVYANIITGVTAAQLANEYETPQVGIGLMASVAQSGPAGEQSARAEPLADWDLRVFNFGADMADPQAFLLESNWLAMRYALDYDCKLFDVNGVCVAINAQYSSYDGYAEDSEFAGTVSGAVQFGGKFRVGGFLDFRTGPDDYPGVSDVSMMPMFGLFLGYSDAPDGTGVQARVSGAYQHGRADLTHVNLMGEAVRASGDAGLDTWGTAAELGYGYGFGNGQVLTPFLGVTYATSQRDSYTDSSDGGEVADTLHFDSYAASYATGVFGLRLQG
ncbi:autotransporter outer membrane beta-barrel domain-containing protein, partial [Nostoc sp. NIES-2111]